MLTGIIIATEWHPAASHAVKLYFGLILLDAALVALRLRTLSAESCAYRRRDDMPRWVWNMEWEMQPDPIPGQFSEVACFESPGSSQHKRHNADIVCGVEFSPDGRFLASAGVTKQARALPQHC